METSTDTAMHRDTRQRRAIRSVFEKAQRPLKPQEVHEQAQHYVANLGIATVYRTINALVEEGWLRQVSLPGDSPRYEVYSDHHHHYFQCRGCGRAYEIGGCPESLASLVPPGFVMDGHEVVLYGKCEKCARQS